MLGKCSIATVNKLKYPSVAVCIHESIYKGQSLEEWTQQDICTRFALFCFLYISIKVIRRLTLLVSTRVLYGHRYRNRRNLPFPFPSYEYIYIPLYTYGLDVFKFNVGFNELLLAFRHYTLALYPLFWFCLISYMYPLAVKGLSYV